MIPRGLRIKKITSIGHGETDFKQKWEAVLNKCSLDLMLLLIETQKQISKIKEEIAAKREESYLQFEDKLKDDLEQLTKKLKQEKLGNSEEMNWIKRSIMCIYGLKRMKDPSLREGDLCLLIYLAARA